MDARRVLNLGILAHVDAGKTSLTERLLLGAGVIDRLGSVDAGSTQTDTLALERRRGITIRSAVVSFTIGGTAVNLIDTPGHPDFIAEVERVLGVLDGAVLVVSAVEGVQAQTRILFRTLRRLRIPTLLFVNKIDRGGADPGRVLAELARRLTPDLVPMGTVTGAGGRDAAFVPRPPDRLDVLAEHDDALLAAYVEDAAVAPGRLRVALAAQSRRALVHPVWFGSAITGAGVAELTRGLTRYLPAPRPDPAGPARGTVFKVERGPAGEKVAYLRLWSGSVRTRDVVRLGGREERREGKVTALSVFDGGRDHPAPELPAGRIAKVWGLADVRVGDPVGEHDRAAGRQFAPPTLASVVRPVHDGDRIALFAALAQLAEQDPLIDLRADEGRGELAVSLYGEVQKEVLQATLAEEYGLAVAFRASSTICVERPAGTGAAFELMGRPGNPFRATVGLRVAPAPPGGGVTFGLAVEPGSMPAGYFAAVEDTVHATLREGLHGWQVLDCAVTMTHSQYKPPPTSPADFRNLTPLVLMSALARAGTEVLEPMHGLRLEAPPDVLAAVLAELARLGGAAEATQVQGAVAVLEGEIPAGRVHELQQRLPPLTRGEGVLESAFDHYRPVARRLAGPVPSRPRTDANPLRRKEYLLHVQRRV